MNDENDPMEVDETAKMEMGKYYTSPAALIAESPMIQGAGPGAKVQALGQTLHKVIQEEK